MIHILKKIADWIVEHEASDAKNCQVPDEIIDEWEAAVDDEIETRFRRLLSQNLEK